MIQARILQALAIDAAGECRAALTALAPALALAAPEGYVRCFADEGAHMAELLHRACAQGIAREYVTNPDILCEALSRTIIDTALIPNDQ